MRSLIIVLAVVLAACSDPSSPARILEPTAPSFGLYDPARPAPTNVSATLIGTGVDGDTVAITFTDAAEGEYLTSAYFPSTAAAAAATDNIPGTAEASGERTATVVVQRGHTAVMLRNLWTTDFHDPAQNVWGPFSAAADVTAGAVIATVTTKGNGKGKR